MINLVDLLRRRNIPLKEFIKKYDTYEKCVTYCTERKLNPFSEKDFVKLLPPKLETVQTEAGVLVVTEPVTDLVAANDVEEEKPRRKRKKQEHEEIVTNLE